ncbi:hypothetical protein L596_001740 [Steinernema carpocapsae]|uniref:Uncharacterized protein n=1 Tax=Steinernema carpocapsae TaxID=34508 RepID=A0A4U8UR05_STECR|nr:hypothetical protein L596_001740 [Steinernema carpocapsae]
MDADELLPLDMPSEERRRLIHAAMREYCVQKLQFYYRDFQARSAAGLKLPFSVNLANVDPSQHIYRLRTFSESKKPAVKPAEEKTPANLDETCVALEALKTAPTREVPTLKALATAKILNSSSASKQRQDSGTSERQRHRSGSCSSGDGSGEIRYDRPASPEPVNGNPLYTIYEGNRKAKPARRFIPH